MKYIVVLGDGMADRPIQELGGRTPLQAAKKPNMDYIAAKGRCGLLRTLSDGFPLGSDVANLSILGYDPREYYSGGRGPLEAASQGIKLGKCDIALRCNLVAEEGGVLTDHGGGHVESIEAAELMAAASKAFGKKGVEFYPGVGYRNLLVLRGKYSTDMSLTPPHDIVGQRIDAHLPNQTSDAGKETAALLSQIMLSSRSILGAHPVNEKRRTAGKPAANMLWFWGAGRRLELPKFKKKFGVSGALISAVDLLRGIAIYLGLEVIDVPGATGYYDTNYEGKADAAVAALSKHDFVYVHVEATDEAGHEGSVQRKVAAIEALDKRLIGRILNSLEGTKFSIAVLPDHATPVSVRTHTTDPVPFAIYSPQKEGDSVCVYDEASAARGSYGLRDGKEFMELLFG
jgi:2,3-bisphosphoglycerate-independent phosphoglycerate mutase